MSYTLAAATQLIEEFKKSRFLTRAVPLHDFTEFDVILRKLREEEQATHHCWAWKFGNQYRFSDDGEPTGTAGKPILNAIEGRDCDRIAIIITRWYGGTELGTGGLARAYGGGAARCLQQAQLIEIIEMTDCRFHASFSEWPLVESKLSRFHATISELDFGSEGVAVNLSLPLIEFDAFAFYLSELSRGRIILKPD